MNIYTFYLSFICTLFQIPAEDLRWAVGCIVAEDNDRPDPAVVAVFESKGYKVFSFPATENAIVSSFPYVSGVSISLANFKVYPAIGAYVEVMISL